MKGKDKTLGMRDQNGVSSSSKRRKLNGNGDHDGGIHSASCPPARTRRSQLCSVCRREIADTIQFECLVCKNYVQCVGCFNEGKAVPPHATDHKYRVRPYKDICFYDDAWNVDDELLLLEALELYGIGNWKAIGEHTDRDPKECKRHFDDIYLKSDKFPLPSKPKRDLAADDGDVSGDIKDATRPKVGKGKSSKHGRASHATGTKPKKNLDIAGYMPKRGDFDIEYDNNAELLLADLEFDDDDTEDDRQLKLKMLDIYDQKLRVREQMKKIVLEHGLLDFKNRQAIERKRSKAEREIYNAYRCFARFWSAEEHEEYVQGLVKELDLRRRISKLQRYRANGMRTLEEVEAYEQSLKQTDGNVLSSRRHTRPVISSSSLARNKTVDTTTVSGTNNDTASESMSQVEQRLCTSLGLSAPNFIRLRSQLQRLILSTTTAGSAKCIESKQRIASAFTVDIVKVDRAYDFYVRRTTEAEGETVQL